eukprot:1062067-Amphidinium_carterae.3
MCECERYVALGSRLSVVPPTVKLWTLDHEGGNVKLQLKGKEVEFAISNAATPLPIDGVVDNVFTTSVWGQ